MAQRQQNVEAAKKAHQEGSFDTMCQAMVRVVQENPKLSAEERNMLYIAYKGAASKRRYELKENANNAQAARDLEAYCAELINTLSQTVIPSAGTDTDAKVFYYKVMGDFYRYYDEVKPNQSNKDAALQCYQTATDWAASGLQPTNPLRLNVALNFGVYYEDTIRNPQKALEITKSAIDAARPSLPSLDQSGKQEASFVLSLLMDNATLWSKNLGQQEPAPIDGLVQPPPQQQQQGGAPPQGQAPPAGYPGYQGGQPQYQQPQQQQQQQQQGYGAPPAGYPGYPQGYGR